MYDTFIESDTDPCGAIIVKDEVNHNASACSWRSQGSIIFFFSFAGFRVGEPIQSCPSSSHLRLAS